ncbi:MAG: HlyD family secretion protein [Acidobacteriaceae bacterium]|nr:HlyD family secretion protein [Acidobacteriaceae bacterium]
MIETVTKPEQTKPEPKSEPAAPPETRPKVWLRPAILVISLVAAFAVWRLYFHTPPLPDSIVALSGRIEGDDSAVSPKTAGRIVQITVREGDQVKADQIIASLDDEQVRAREQQARAALIAAEAKMKSAQAQIAVLEEQLRQYQMQTGQARVDANGRVRQAEADLAAAQADLKQQEASYALAEFDREAYTKLAETGAVSERQGKQSVTTAEQQAAAVAANRRRVESAQGALETARANLATAGIRESQAAAVERQILQQRAEIASAKADTQQAQFSLQEAEANRSDLIIRAPFDGTVITRAAEPGEVVTAGTAIITLLDLSKVYLRGYVPEGQIGKVALNQQARVYLDSNPSEPIPAYVLRIDPQATFTPENTYFRDDRVKEVVGVKLQLKGGIGYAKPGMPADGEILVSGDTWPVHKRK